MAVKEKLTKRAVLKISCAIVLVNIKPVVVHTNLSNSKPKTFEVFRGASGDVQDCQKEAAHSL